MQNFNERNLEFILQYCHYGRNPKNIQVKADYKPEAISIVLNIVAHLSGGESSSKKYQATYARQSHSAQSPIMESYFFLPGIVYCMGMEEPVIVSRLEL